LPIESVFAFVGRPSFRNLYNNILIILSDLLFVKKTRTAKNSVAICGQILGQQIVLLAQLRLSLATAGQKSLRKLFD
jgi:cadmium resistance protein CadD (predicted permease)